MALTPNYSGIAEDAINKVFNRTGQLIGQVNTALNTDYSDLLMKAADAKISQLGTPVIDHITFYTNNLNIGSTSGSYAKKKFNTINTKIGELRAKKDYIIRNYEKQVQALEHAFNVIGVANDVYAVLVNDVLINVNRARNTIKTTINGMDGTVKQFMQNDDFQLSFDVLLAGTNKHQTDVKRIRQLTALFSLPNSINVNSIYLNNFGINAISIDDFSFTQNREYGNLTQLSITASSDNINYSPVEEILL